MPTLERQNIQEIATTIEHLYCLTEVLQEQVENLKEYQLKALLEITCDLSSKVYSWSEKEEAIVLELEGLARNDKPN